jgi:fumarate hydratase class II
MGSVTVPASAYYGAQTQRALDNFRISGLVFPRTFIRALGIIKEAAAYVNMQLGLLDKKKGKAISQAAQEVTDGKLDPQFVVDIFHSLDKTSREIVRFTITHDYPLRIQKQAKQVATDCERMIHDP